MVTINASVSFCTHWNFFRKSVGSAKFSKVDGFSQIKVYMGSDKNFFCNQIICNFTLRMLQQRLKSWWIRLLQVWTVLLFFLDYILIGAIIKKKIMRINKDFSNLSFFLIVSFKEMLFSAKSNQDPTLVIIDRRYVVLRLRLIDKNSLMSQNVSELKEVLNVVQYYKKIIKNIYLYTYMRAFYVLPF